MSQPKFGYHEVAIPKGVLGEFSKIEEEFRELGDAVNQQVKIMVLCELSDLIGAIELYLQNHHPDFTLEDLIRFSKMTQNAFKLGER